MTIEKVKKIIVLAQGKTMPWIKSEGATCPVCQFLGASFFRVPSYKTDGDVRYHKCHRCGTNFKSVEIKEKQEIILPSKVPEKQDKSREMKQNKVRKRKK